MKYLRWHLFPVSLVYGFVTIIRNWLYDWGLLKSTAFDLPVISVGNLDVGGAGKTPMTEYLIRLLESDYQLATLSRGYGRHTKGFYIATADSPASEVGDEPAQLKHKFPQVNVSVCEDRVAGVSEIQSYNEVIILDDAYQHRAIKPGISLLLFDYCQLMGVNLLLPAGNRRELFAGRKRADLIVVTKCPSNLDADQQQILRRKLKPYAHQQVFFSRIAYMDLQAKGTTTDFSIDSGMNVFLLTGIANPEPMYQYLAQGGARIFHHKYPDHHRFSLKNIAKLAADFEACPADKKLIITTEKDMQRLQEQDLLHLTQSLPIYTLPIGTVFINGADDFNQLIKNYVRQHTAHRSLY